MEGGIYSVQSTQLIGQLGLRPLVSTKDGSFGKELNTGMESYLIICFYIIKCLRS